MPSSSKKRLALDYLILLAPYLLLAITVYFLWGLVKHDWYLGHLAYDARFNYEPKAVSFLAHGDFAHLSNNERLPGELLFIAVLSPVLNWQSFPNLFLHALMGANVVLTLLIAFLVHKWNGRQAVTLLSLVLLCFGPIFLFRLDLLACLLLMLSLYLWHSGRSYYSIFVLVLASLTKLFPVLILPYLLLLKLFRKNYLSALLHLLWFLCTASLLSILFMQYFDVSFQFFLDFWQFHTAKPVHVESLWGSLITFYNSTYLGVSPEGLSGGGIFGIQEKFTILPMGFYSYFWVFPLLCIYILVGIRSRKNSVLEIVPVVLIFLSFLIFLKSLCPQYMLWFAILFPVLSVQHKFKMRSLWSTALIVLFAIGMITQYVYPVNYTELLEFYQSKGSPDIFYALLLRNLFLLVLWIVMILKYTGSTESEKCT